jgi:hypothetical protein
MTEDHEVVDAARAFVTSTDVFAQPVGCRKEFALLAVAIQRHRDGAKVISLDAERAKRRPATVA